MLKRYPNGLIGYDSVGETEFGLYGSDSEFEYHKNYINAPDDWYYSKNQVTYIRNSNGHRSVEIDDLPDDFILTIGCSKTVGSAVELERTYPYLLSKHLCMAYYNLAVEASGLDLLSYNLSTFLKIRIPKLVVIQYPESFRTFRELGSNILPIGPWSVSSKVLPINVLGDFKLVVGTDYMLHYNQIIRHNIQTMLELLNIKTIEVEVPIKDYGRDLQHPGIESHRTAFEHIINEANY